jgi:alkanesulfonate monooxygenase SsuD/methylene tetrahydromethanopterin reductase-like flavin-dependent oxidoreductase (luciferase family)
MKIGVLLPSRFEDPGDFFADARAMEAAGVDSVWLEEDESHDAMLGLAAIAAVTGQLRLGLILGSSPVTNGALDRRMETLQQLSRQRVITLPGAERWQRVEVPADREAWARTLEQAHPNFEGVIVPLDPRLLDILRHPEDAIDRPDLQLAQG